MTVAQNVAVEVEAAINELRSSIGRKDYALRYLEGAFELLKTFVTPGLVRAEAQDGEFPGCIEIQPGVYVREAGRSAEQEHAKHCDVVVKPYDVNSQNRCTCRSSEQEQIERLTKEVEFQKRRANENAIRATEAEERAERLQIVRNDCVAAEAKLITERDTLRQQLADAKRDRDWWKQDRDVLRAQLAQLTEEIEKLRRKSVVDDTAFASANHFAVDAEMRAERGHPGVLARMVKLPDPNGDDVGSALLQRLAARLDAVLRDRGWKKTFFAHGKVHANTVRRIFDGKDHRVSTLAEIADALECDVVISITPRRKNGDSQANPQDIAHDS